MVGRSGKLLVAAGTPEKQRAVSDDLQLALEAAGAGAWRWDIATGAVQWTGNVEKVFGLEPDGFAGTYDAFLELLHPDDRASVEAAIDDALERRGRYEVVHRIIWRSGRTRWLKGVGEVVTDESGEPIALLGIVLDETERVEGEREVSAYRKRLRMALEAARAGIWTWDATSGEVQWSPELELIHGLVPGTFKGTFEAAASDVHPDDRDTFVSAVREAIDTKGAYGATYRIVLPDGSIRWLEAVGDVLKDSKGNATGLTGVCRDVTERMTAEQTLRASEERFRGLFESAAVGVALIDLDDRLVEINETFAALLGDERGELVGRDYRELIVEADELEKAERQRRELLAGERGAYTCELHLMKVDGSLVPIRTWVSLVLDAERRPLYTVAAIASMEELRELEDQVRQAQKMEALGLLAGGIAHDFNNLLGVIALQTERLLDRLPHGREEHDALLDIGHAAERAAQLTRQLLTFARSEAIAERLLDLNDTVLGMQRMLMRLISADVEVVWDLESDAKPVRADAGQLEQILMNLIVNALDAVSAGGRIAIATRTIDVAADNAKTGLRAGRYVTLSVTDNGTGIEPEVLQRIFEPFFTTKERERGTGLGLTTVYGIVENAGGTLTVDSVPGQGTTFTIHLPQADQLAQPASARRDGEPAAEAAPAAATGGRVLVVEDDEGMLKLSEAVLTEAGYIVRSARGAEQALELLKQDNRVDLLVTDISMPVMSGKDLAAAVRRLFRNVPVLYMTGYDRGLLALGTDEDDGGRTDLVQKPFAIGEFRDKVARLLDTASL